MRRIHVFVAIFGFPCHCGALICVTKPRRGYSPSQGASFIKRTYTRGAGVRSFPHTDGDLSNWTWADAKGRSHASSRLTCARVLKTAWRCAAEKRDAVQLLFRKTDRLRDLRDRFDQAFSWHTSSNLRLHCFQCCAGRILTFWGFFVAFDECVFFISLLWRLA